LGPWVLAGAGDIGWCPADGNPAATGRLLQALPPDATIFTAGDNAYPHGEKGDFDKCYAPFWGPFFNRTNPSPGNHEYETAGAGPYFDYFGANAGPRERGYYSYSFGNPVAWLVLSLNSQADMRPGSPQQLWIADELAAKPASCAIAIWHYPLFSSGPNPKEKPAEIRALWQMLYDAGVDIVINGHDHLYERFAPQNSGGVPDPAKGIRQFTVGTGGAALYTAGAPVVTSEKLIKAFGILKLTLTPGTYQWQFIPDSGGGDSGSGTCH
jgi:Calcineurin-like phosphoesterase